MNQELIDAHTNILHLDSTKCRIVGLKLLGKSESTGSNLKVYRFIAIVQAPTILPNMLPSDNDVASLRNMQYENIYGPDVCYKIKWKKKNKKISFEVRGQLTPHSILKWEIFEGNYYIKTEVYGNFD